MCFCFKCLSLLKRSPCSKQSACVPVKNCEQDKEKKKKCEKAKRKKKNCEKDKKKVGS